MTADERALDAARGLRRLLAAFVIAALAAAGVALAFFVTHHPSTNKRSIFPARFTQAGFLSGSARLDRSYDADAGERHVTGELSPGRTAYLVALCDHGGMVIAIGATRTSQPCIGRPVGVIALQVPKPVQLNATVTAPQSTTWGLAIYR